MKQTIFMVIVTFLGTAGVLVWGPFAAVATYYCYAVLRPQFMWWWALPWDVAWSQYAALAAMIGSYLAAFGFVPAPIDPRVKQRMAGAHLTMLAFGSWIVLTYLTARNREVAWTWFLEYVKIFVMFGVGAAIVGRTKQVYILYLITTASLVYIAYEINLAYLVDGRLDIYNRGYGGFDNNGAGLMLAMGVPLSIFAWECVPHIWRWAFLAGVPFLLHAVLMSYSRGAMLSLLIGLPYALARSAHKGRALAVALVLAWLVPIFAGQEIRNRFFSINQYQEDDSANIRLDSWRVAFRIANDSPIYGVGIRNANLLAYEYGADMHGRTIHSQYFQLMADAGYVGLAFYLLALSSVAYSLFRARRLLRRQPLDAEGKLLRGLISGIEGALLVFAIGATFLSLEVFELPYLLLLIGSQIWVLVRAREADMVSVIAREPQVSVAPPLASGISPSWVPRP